MPNIRLICHKPGFLRCGIAHAASNIWPEDHWSKEQILIFENDRMFEVFEVGENEEIDEPVQSPQINLSELSGDHPDRMGAIDAAIHDLAPRDYDSDGNPIIKSLVSILEFVPMPEEIEASFKRTGMGKTSSEWGLVIRADAIEAAIKKLGKGDFTQAGTPKVSVLEKALGFKPTTDEIKQALKE